jgi:uncharacterized iron-regulated protein
MRAPFDPLPTMHKALVGLAASLLLAGCSASGPAPQVAPNAARQAPAWKAPPIGRQLSVREGRNGERLELAALLDRLAAADVVFVGETHDDETTHRAELAIYEGVRARRRGQVVLALEMFERDVQPALDDYLAGRTAEEQFLSNARPWNNYATAYRPLIESARAAHLPVVASNFPAPLRRKVAREGQTALDAARAQAPNQVPAELLESTPEYWRRVDNATRGHSGMMGGGGGDEDRRISTQSLWDNSMGESCARALDAHPGWSVVHVNGGFHSQYWDGTVRQLRLRRPELAILTVALVPATDPAVEEVSGAALADFVVFAERRARDVSDGAYAVHVQRELEYRLHLPESASRSSPVPLLIWLGDDGLPSSEGLALWRERLGNDCAIAAFDPPYRALQSDLSEGGSWFWSDTFSEDLDVAREAVERAWGYLLRHYPIDPARVCIAGEGTGATVAAGTLLLTSSLSARGVALHPRSSSHLRDVPLPLPEAWGKDTPPARSLEVLAAERDGEWWRDELGQYDAVGLSTAFAQSSDDPWLDEVERENALRAALGLQPIPVPANAPRVHAVAEGATAAHWARRLGLARQHADGSLFAILSGVPSDERSTPLDLSVSAASFSADRKLPRCPGAFGGSTIVVVAPGTDAAEVDAWLALEATDPLTAASPFHRLRIACDREGRSLHAVLDTLRTEGRSNALIVPAVFCADANTMTALQREAGDLTDSMSLHWSPGLGAPTDR